MNLFEQASRQKVRFQSTKGELTTEQLWDLPLTNSNGFNLDAVARDVHRDLKAVSEESFVTMARPNPAQARLELKMEIVKHIIGVKLAEAEQAKTAADRANERQRLMEILNKKQDAALEALTPEEIKARLDALG